MTQINSPFLLSKIRPIRELSKQENNYHDQIERILQQIYRRIGGPVDNIDDNIEESSANENQIALNLALINDLSARVNDIESDTQPQIDFSPRWNDISTSSDHTLTDWDDVSATGRITLKLPANPVPDAEYIIGNDDGVMKTVDGNGRNIRRKTSSSTIRTKAKGTRLHFRYKININEYVLL